MSIENIQYNHETDEVSYDEGNHITEPLSELKKRLNVLNNQETIMIGALQKIQSEKQQLQEKLDVILPVQEAVINNLNVEEILQ